MHPARAIVATPSAPHLAMLNSTIAPMPDIVLTAHAPGIMELFDAVESDPPELVIVSEELTNHPDFKLLYPLFEALDVRWVKFCKDEGNSDLLTQKRPADVFELGLSQPAHAIRLKLRSLLLRKRNTNLISQQEKRTKNGQFSKIVLIGASTGGVDALKTVLSNFESDCPPTIVLQHTTQRFGNGLPAVLSKTCKAEILRYEPELEIEKGRVYILAGEDQHVVLSKTNDIRLVGCDSPPMSGHRPSIDKLFLSAVPYAKKTVAAILTGMGQDGAKGLLALREAGATTFAQDERTSLVFGMPGTAWSNGGAQKQIALGEMGNMLLRKSNK